THVHGVLAHDRIGDVGVDVGLFQVFGLGVFYHRWSSSVHAKTSPGSLPEGEKAGKRKPAPRPQLQGAGLHENMLLTGCYESRRSARSRIVVSIVPWKGLAAHGNSASISTRLSETSRSPLIFMPIALKEKLPP